MNKHRYMLWILILALQTWVFGSGKTASSKESFDQSRHYARTFLEVSGVPGFAVAIGHNGRVVWQEGFGWADLANKVKADPQTRFRLGSVSKLITVAAAARLYERGILNIDAPVTQYVDPLPAVFNQVTAKRLAGHIAGVRHYKSSDEALSCRHFAAVKESLQVFVNDPLMNTPGSTYLYSTFGYVLLSAVLEGASGKLFLDLLQQEVYRPLQMKDSGPDLLTEIIPHRTAYYERTDGRLLHARWEDPSYKWAAGGLLSTVSDLVRFGMAHLKPGYLKDSTLSMLFTSQQTNDGKETGVGFGWRIGKDWRGRRIYHHAGRQAGSRAVLLIYPEEQLAISILSNANGEPPAVERTAQMIAEPFLNKNITRMNNVSALYELTAVVEGKTSQSTMMIERKGNAYGGNISGDFPLRELLRKNKVSDRIAIADVFAHEKKMIIVLATAFGLLDMAMTPAEKGYQGILEAGPLKMEITAKKKS